MKRSPLLRKSELRSKAMKPWRRAEADKVTPDVRSEVMRRDQGCVANLLGAKDACTDAWGRALILQGRYTPYLLELDHIRPAAMTGKRGPSTPRWMVAMCPGHHRLGNPPWATSNRDLIREYLDRVSGEDVW